MMAPDLTDQHLPAHHLDRTNSHQSTDTDPLISDQWSEMVVTLPALPHTLDSTIVP